MLVIFNVVETMCSSSTKKGERSKKEPADNANIGAETNVGREKGIHNNSFGNYLIPSVTKISQTNYAVTNGHGNNDLSLTWLIMKNVAVDSVQPVISGTDVHGYIWYIQALFSAVKLDLV